MAVLMVAAGLWLGDYVLPLVAIFIVFVAQAEGRAVRLESAMRRLRVGQFALWDMGGISPDRPLTHALRGGPRDLVVTKDGRVEGMLWRHHLLRELNRGDEHRLVSDVMVPANVVADVDESVYDVQQRMNQHNTWAVPITEDDQYRGIFTADRFVHVYRQITPRPLAPRSPHGFAGSVTAMIRARLK
jgi:CBS domain-containing protein